MRFKLQTRVCTCPGNLASSVNHSKKRNKLAEASCKTCGGRFLVDGIEAVSRSMVGTVGLEVASSINSEFNWNTVTKGKRSRKAVARCMNRGLPVGHSSPKRVGDFSGSDSDKFGETGNGQSLSDKADYVPLKKRRHFLRSPSPSSRPPLFTSPQVLTSSSQSEDLISDHNGSSGSYTNGGAGPFRSSLDKVPGHSSGGLDNSDNFSGIALLAAAACFNNIDEEAFTDKLDATEVSSASQRSDDTSFLPPQTESMHSSESGKQLHKQVLSIENKENSLVMGSVDASCSSCENKELVTGKSASPKVDRRHWDLNTSMDAWEQPINYDGIGKEDNSPYVSNVVEQKMGPEGSETVNQRNDVEPCLPLDKVENDVDFDDAIGKEDNNSYVSNTGEQTMGLNGSEIINQRNDAERCPPLDKIENAVNFPISEFEENDLEKICCDHGTSMKESSLNGLHVASRQHVHSSSEDTDLSSHDISRNEHLNSPEAESCHSSKVSGKYQDTKSYCMDGTHIEDKCKIANASLLSNPSDNNAAFKDDSASEKLVGKGDGLTNISEDYQKTSALPDNSLEKEICLDSCQALNPKNSESGLHNDKQSSIATSIGGESDNSSDAKGDSAELLAGNTLGTSAGEDAGLKEILAKHEDPQLSNGGSEKIHMMEKSGTVPEDPENFEAGYDSPYEDGELRGSVLNFCEVNEFEEGEQECLDYESEGRVGEDSDAGDSKTVEADSEGSDKRSVLAVPGRETDFVKCGYGSSVRIGEEINDALGEKVSNQGSGTTEEISTDLMVERDYCGARRHYGSDHMDVNEELGEVRSKTNRGKMLSRIERPSLLDTLERNVDYGRSRDVGDRYLREQRDGVPDRFVTGYRSDVHYRGRRNEGDGECDYWNSRERFPSGYRAPEGRGQTRLRPSFGQSVDKFGVESRNHRHPFNYTAHVGRDNGPDRYAPRFRSGHERDRNEGNGQMTNWGPRMRYPYHGPEGNGLTRPRCALPDSFDKYGGYNSYDRKEFINSSSRMMQGPPDWRRSPIDRDDYHDGPRRNSGLSSRGSRGGFRNRVFRDEFHHPMDEENVTSVRTSHYAPWRERKFLPHSSRGALTSLPRRSSRSRSRTRSPRPWLPQRERNVGARHHSRSPDFRSESQMERGRVPFQNRNFEADYDDSLVSPPRGRFSPQRNFRRAEEQNISDSHMRQRRSPFNGYGQGKRMDSVGLSGRLKSEDSSFRQTLRPGRFPPVSGVGRGCKLEDGNEEKALGDRSETVQ